MIDLISVGSISIDLYFQGDNLTKDTNRFHLAIGGKYQTDYFHIDVGGGGTNVAIGSSKLGLKSALLSTIGENLFKNFILNKLKKYKINYELCDFVKDYYNISSIFLTKKGERTIIHYTASSQKLFDHHIKISSIKKAKILYLGNLPEISIKERIRLISFAKNYQILTVLNLGVKDCRRPKNELVDLLKNIDILIINGYEFAELVKANYKDIFFEEDIISHYISFLKNKIVIITQGEKGSFGYFDKKVFYTRAFKSSKIVDTTGAGDGYVSGFITHFYKSGDILKSMEKGSLYASKIIGKIGAN